MRLNLTFQKVYKWNWDRRQKEICGPAATPHLTTNMPRFTENIQGQQDSKLHGVNEETETENLTQTPGDKIKPSSAAQDNFSSP